MATLTVGDMTRKEALLAELASEVKHPPAREPAPPSDTGLAKLRELGTEIWLDTGNLDEARKLWRREMSALTTNNTLANQVVQTGVMDDDIREAARRVRQLEPSISPSEMVLDVAFVINCHIALRLVHALGARVSVELHPSIAHDVEKTYRYAQRYHAVNPDRFIVKIPLTPEGYCAVARARADGIPINFTLGFSARQNYLAAVVSRPNYCNVFLGRLNSVVVDNHLGDGKYVGEKTTLASQQAVAMARQQNPDTPTKQIAASMRSGDQLAALAGVDVFTAPPKAVEEFLAAGYNPEHLHSRLQDNLEVTLDSGQDPASLDILWTVDDRFKAFAADLAERNRLHLTGEDLREADRDHGARLFTRFAPEEQAAIRQKGKIPELSRWGGRVSLDDLMTESALQSFVTDQDALDARIRKLVESA